MALSSNPTRTRTIEENWLRDINRRWKRFTKNTTKALISLNADGNISSDVLINKGADFVLSASQQRTFMAFMQSQIDQLLMGTPEPPNWQAQYQIQSYQRGIDSTRQSLISQGIDIVLTPEEAISAQGLQPFTATPSLGGGTVTAPIHQDALQFLYTRSYDKLKGWTDDMATQTRQILFDGVSQGKGIDDVVRDMVDRINVSRTRARVIARTETIQAYQQSSTNEAERASIEIGSEILLRWLTVRDNRVRHLHATWHGTLATPKENRARINVSPWNCRCGQAPVIPEANTEKKRKKFAKEREQLLLLERR
jgi:SPP1 gp7 family putative phage head morphogenesis protein